MNIVRKSQKLDAFGIVQVEIIQGLNLVSNFIFRRPEDIIQHKAVMNNPKIFAPEDIQLNQKTVCKIEDQGEGAGVLKCETTVVMRENSK